MKKTLLPLLSLGSYSSFVVHGLSIKAAPMKMKRHQRKFRFVPYGDVAPVITDNDGGGEDDKLIPTIACDGRVKGATLELTHWTDNETPDSLYADTSTEMALNFVTTNDKSYAQQYDNAVVLNNHYDTDGVLSSWSCIQQLDEEGITPSWVSKYKTLLIEGAEAGDFGEWSSDLGVKLDLCIEGIASEASSEEDAYETVLETGFLPTLLDDLLTTGGEAYKNLWESGFEHAMQGYKDIQEGRCVLRQGPGKIVILEESNARNLSSYALHRGLRENNLWKGTTRILRVTKSSSNESRKYGYQYEKIGHGWVKKLVDRHIVPDVDGDLLSDEMNLRCENDSAKWVSGGSSGLVAICKTRSGTTSTMTPDEISNLFLSLDDGAN